jgi:benzylsuccinate CoA-transferase BbsF subunit
VTDRLLEGIRAVEIGQYLALPLAGRLLDALGAEIIKVETNKLVDPMSFVPPETLGAGLPTWSGTKRRISLDIRTTTGREILERLVEVSDIFMTNLELATLKRWGLDMHRLRQIKADIIIAWITAMGGEGPYAHYTGYGPGMAPLSGITSLTGEPGETPLYIGSAYSDFHAPAFLVAGILRALMRRRQTGEGSLVECSVFTAGAATIGPASLDYQANGRLPQRMGNREVFAAPHGIYRCRGKDRWCAIAVFNDKEWDSFCEALGNPQWISDPEFITLRCRMANAAVLDKLISQWTENHSAEEVAETMQRSGIAASVVSQGEDQIKDMHLKERDFFKKSNYYRVDIEKPQKDWSEAGPVIIPSVPPIAFSETPCRFGRYHRLGEDNDYVYRQLLKMSSDEIAKLSEKGIFF